MILSVGLSVRFPITSVSPLLDDIGRDYGLSASGLAALSAIPVLLAGLAFGPLPLAPVMVAVLGIAQSAAFGLAVALIVFTAPSAARTAGFSAVSQGIGYAFAAAGPLLLGLLAQAGLDWSAILALLIVAACGELAFGAAASRKGAGRAGTEPRKAGVAQRRSRARPDSRSAGDSRSRGRSGARTSSGTRISCRAQRAGPPSGRASRLRA
ncbi:MAG: hypothetical protein QM606_04595 [Leucobacter sp.]